VVFDKEYITGCSSTEWIARNGCALRWCHRGVGRQTEETVGFSEWTAQVSVWKTTGKDSCEACGIAYQNCAIYLIFPSGMTSLSKVAQFNWECVATLMSVSRQLNWDGDHITVFWLSAPYSIIFVSMFRLMSCLHLQGKSVCCGWILCDWHTLLSDHFSIHPNNSVILKLEADHHSAITVRTVSQDDVLQNRAGSCGDEPVSAVVQPEGSCCSPHPSASSIVSF